MLSQFAVRGDLAARRQARRVSDVLRALGWTEAVVTVDETQREGWRDDVHHLAGALRDRLSVVTSRASRP